MHRSNLLISLIIAVLVASCSTSPTGRPQLILKSDAEGLEDPYNQLGQLVYQHVEDQAQGKQQLQWDAQDQPEGLYYYQLHAGDQVATGKLVKVK